MFGTNLYIQIHLIRTESRCFFSLSLYSNKKIPKNILMRFQEEKRTKIFRESFIIIFYTLNGNLKSTCSTKLEALFTTQLGFSS